MDKVQKLDLQAERLSKLKRQAQAAGNTDASRMYSKMKWELREIREEITGEIGWPTLWGQTIRFDGREPSPELWRE